MLLDGGGSVRMRRKVIGSRYWKRRDGIISWTGQWLRAMMGIVWQQNTTGSCGQLQNHFDQCWIILFFCVWKRDGMDTSIGFGVIFEVGCSWEIHMGETGHVYVSFQSWWEPLSRVIWRGWWNVQLPLPTVVSVVSLGRPSQSNHFARITSHDQYGCFVILLELECMIAHLNGF